MHIFKSNGFYKQFPVLFQSLSGPEEVLHFTCTLPSSFSFWSHRWHKHSIHCQICQQKMFHSIVRDTFKSPIYAEEMTWCFLQAQETKQDARVNRPHAFNADTSVLWLHNVLSKLFTVTLWIVLRSMFSWMFTRGHFSRVFLFNVQNVTWLDSENHQASAAAALAYKLCQLLAVNIFGVWKCNIKFSIAC